MNREMHCIQFDYQLCTFIFKFFQIQRNFKTYSEKRGDCTSHHELYRFLCISQYKVMILLILVYALKNCNFFKIGTKSNMNFVGDLFSEFIAQSSARRVLLSKYRSNGIIIE